MKLENLTPFEADRFAVMDEIGADLLLVIIKATYKWDEQGKLSIADKQEKIEMADQYYDQPDNSSIRYASDFSFDKVATDIAVRGSAWAPKGLARESLISMQVGKLKKTIKVTGDRYWVKTMGGLTMSDPKPFDKIPLMFERAYGGTDLSNPDLTKHDREARNPVGVGFRAKSSTLNMEDTRLPNFEDPENLIKSPGDKPIPAGFGFIGPSWQPRLSYAGTYDEAWQKGRMPLLPTDFDKKFFNSVPPDMIYDGYLEGKEQVLISGMSPKSKINFILPGDLPSVMIDMAGLEEQSIEMKIDRLFISSDEYVVIMVWNGCIRIPVEFREIENIKCSLNN
jgi:hypothetical protein